MMSQGPNQIVTTVGRNIARARVACSLTQRALAADLGLDTRAVNRWERGGILPSPANLTKLSERLGRDIAWFYVEHEPQEDAA